MPGFPYDALADALLIDCITLKQTVGAATTAQAEAVLAGLGFTPAASTLRLDVSGLVTTLDPTSGYFGHDELGAWPWSTPAAA